MNGAICRRKPHNTRVGEFKEKCNNQFDAQLSFSTKLSQPNNKNGRADFANFRLVLFYFKVVTVTWLWLNQVLAVEL